MNENVNYHPLRRCVICNELVEADDPTCAVCGQPACSDHAYDVGGGEWYCADCCHGKTHLCADCGAPSHWRCKDCGKWVCENHSTFVAVQGEEFYTLFGYYCDNDLRWELAEERVELELEDCCIYTSFYRLSFGRSFLGSGFSFFPPDVIVELFTKNG